MKNIYCVGQVVIDNSLDLGRVKRTVTSIIDSDHVVLDSTIPRHNIEIFCIPEYLDNTSYFYHHSQYGKGLDMMNKGFTDLQFVLSEIDNLNRVNPTAHKIAAFLARKLEEAKKEIEEGLRVYRTSIYNLNQWGSKFTLNHHFPYIVEA